MREWGNRGERREIMQTMRRKIFTVAVLVAIIFELDLVVSQSGADSDREALRIFLQGALPSPAFNLSESPCRWPGLTCSDTDNRVTRIDWHSFGLEGAIPQGSIGRLDSLVYLNLYNNSISGSLPTDMWDLGQLQYLNLSRNDLQGSISIALRQPSGLFFLDLSQNRLSGQIPPSIGSLNSLVVLNLSRNDFQDMLPGAIFGCSFLRTLDLSFNMLSGLFPSGLSHLIQLQVLVLRNNRLSGMVPPETSRLHYLTVLDLSENQFTGFFPRVDGLRKLEELNISGNFLSGTIPTGVFRIPSLRTFSARKNLFVGSLPMPSLMLSNLRVVDLGENNLSGSVSSGTWSLNSVEVLRLDGNRLSGVLPSKVGATLKELDLSDNEFSGPVPSDLGAFRGVAYLDFSSNRLSGSVPDRLTGLSSLVHLGLADNPFVESRFPSLQGLVSLRYLNLSAVQLVGGIPEDIGSLAALEQLDLSHNQLNGSLPRTLGDLVSLTWLDASYNQLNGSIPDSMAKLARLQHSNFSYNDLSGDVPAWPFMNPSGLLGNKGLCGSVVNVSCPRGLRPPSDDAPAASRGHSPSGGSSSHRRRVRIAVIVGVATGSTAALLCAAAGLFYCRSSVKVFHKKQESPKEERFISMSGPFSSEMDPSVWAAGVRDPHTIPVVMFEKPLLNLSFSDLVQATANFSKEAQLPDAGCGPAFQGVLPGGIHVAVKILGEGIPSADVASACAQLAAIGRLKHPNVVPLLGYCMVGVERLLVYDFVQDGGDVYGRLHELPEGVPNTDDWSTDTWEHGQEGGTVALPVLPWAVRHRIVLCTARALAFLHHGCSPPVVHGDVKASNVVLDAECEGRLAGTGLAQLVDIGTGEPGYVPPEFASSNGGGNNNNNAATVSSSSREMSPKGDVYSFGVMLLELVTGKRPVGDEYPAGHGNLQSVVQWTRSLVKEKRGFKALDVRVLQGDEDMTEMLEALRVAYLCTAEAPSKRPSMQQVVGLLKDLRPSSSMSGELVGGSF